ncbi:calcium-binding protein, partial [Nioella nitratireducens]|uniref:calcium-binding protein n=1 Tax=Nioella nitratireducens TaxID=1287720 RepID=UPI0011BA4D87
MTTISVQGFQTTGDASPTYVGPHTLVMTISEGETLTYSVISGGATNAFGVPEVDIVTTNGGGGVVNIPESVSNESFISQFNFSGGGHLILLSIYEGSTGIDHNYILESTVPLPTSQAELDALVASVSSVALPTGAYGPGAPIDPTTAILNAVVSVDDTFNGSGTGEFFDGSAGVDELRGNGGNDTLLGGAGDDYIVGGLGNDSLDGGADYDQVAYTDAIAGVNVNLATGIATGGAGTDTISNFQMIRGSMFNDTLTGDDGDNHIRGLQGNDILDGGIGIDRVRYDRDASYGGASGVNVNLTTGVAIDGFGDTDSLSGFERVTGTNVADTIIGDGEDNDLEGRDGNDSLSGGGGRDNLRGGDGDDTLDASGGDSASQGYGDIIQGGAGSNTIIGHAQAFADRGGGGIDVIYENVAGTGGVVITVGANGTGTTTSNNAGVVNDTFTYADNFNGTQDADVFNGSNGGSGTGQGDESWVGEAGNDTINGNGGWDTVQYWLEQGGTNGVNVNLATGVATDSYGDTDSLSGIEAVEGTDRNDTLIGDDNENYFADRDGDDSINAAGGNDWIRLYGGSDTVDGGDGVDTLEIDLRDFTLPAGFVYQLDLTTGYSGQLGDPTQSDSISNIESLMLRGTYDAQVTGDAEDNRFETGTGNDTLTGGAGVDTFIYNGGADVITDFSGDLIGIDA